MKRTIIEESPFSTPGQSLSKRASKLEITGSPAKKNFHPVFTKQTKPVSKLMIRFDRKSFENVMSKRKLD